MRKMLVRGMGLVMCASLLVVAVGACDMHSAPPTQVCARTGEQCRLEDGLLGVCTPTDAADCQDPPCLMCAPQH